jgi:hypothetical protein
LSSDVSFGNNGSIIHSIVNWEAYCVSAILQSDNRIVITGWINSFTTDNNYMARFENDSLFSNITELNLSKKIIYPVPTNDKIFIEDFLVGSSVTIFNSNGQIVYLNSPTNNSIDLHFLSQGIYLMRIESFGKYFTQKFIKE